MMTRLPRLPHAGLALLLAAGCHDSDDRHADGAAGQAPTAGAGGQAPAAGAGGQPQATGGGGQGAGAAGQPASPPASAPYTRPPLNSDACYRPLRAVAAGAEVGAIYRAGSSIHLQRFSPAGEALAGPIELGAAPHANNPYGGLNSSHVSLATDGQTYLGCWDNLAPTGDTSAAVLRTACVSVPVGGGASTPVLTLDAGSPSVAHGPQGFLLASRTATEMTVRRLGATPDASPRTLPIDAPAGVDAYLASVVLTPTASGLAVATFGPDFLYRLGPDLSVLSGPVKLDNRPDWGGAPQMVASGDVLVMSVRVPYGVSVFTLDAHDQQVQPGTGLGGGGKLGTDVALSLEPGGVGMVKATSSLLVHRLLDPLHLLAIEPDPMASSEPDCTLSAVSVPGATLVVYPSEAGVAAARIEHP